MSITLNSVDSNSINSGEAYLSWTIDNTLLEGANSKRLKAMLYLTYLDNNTTNIQKYQLHPSEYSVGFHIFDNLYIGNYGAELVLMNNNMITESSSIVLKVYTLSPPVLSEENVLPQNSGVTVVLPSYSETLLSDQEIRDVTFVLFDKSTLNFRVCDHQNYTFPLNNTGVYVLSSGLNNTFKYEIACFYTDNNNISSSLSNTIAFQPSLLPSKITKPNFEVYPDDYAIVNFNLPVNYQGSQPTSIVFKFDYYMNGTWKSYLPGFVIPISNDTVVDNSPVLFVGADLGTMIPKSQFPANRIFYMPNFANILEIRFSMLLRGELGDGMTSDYTHFVIVQGAGDSFYFNAPALWNKLEATSYDKGGDKIQINFKQGESNPNNNLLHTYSFKIHEVSDPYYGYDPNKIVFQDNNYILDSFINFNFELGKFYVAVLIVTSKWILHDDNNTEYTLYPNPVYFNGYNRIFFNPHLPLTYQINMHEPVSDDKQILLSWDPIPDESTNGVAYTGVELWVLDADNPNDTFAISNENTNLDLILNVNNISRMVNLPNSFTYSYNTRSKHFIMNGKNLSFKARLSGAVRGVFGPLLPLLKAPFSNTVTGHAIGPSTISLISKLPGNNKSQINLAVNLNGGEYSSLNLKVNNVEYTNYTYDSSNHILLVEGLQNDVISEIKIVMETRSSSATKLSNTLIVNTTAFDMPSTTKNLMATPYSNNVVLEWSEETMVVTGGRSFLKEIYYKQSASSSLPEMKTVDNLITSINISGLESNVLYEFKVRNSYYDNESNITYYSDYSTIYSRPFVYVNAPVMDISFATDSKNVSVKISIPSGENSNYYEDVSFNYVASITQGDIQLILSSNDDSLPSRTLIFTDVSLESDYFISCYYEMKNPETNTYYRSSTVSNQVTSYDPTIAPLLTATPIDSAVEISLDVTPLFGLNITGYQRFENDSWVPFNFSSVDSFNVNTVTLSGTNGQAIYIHLRAVMLNADKTVYSASAQVTVVPFKSASAPQNISSQPSNGIIDVYWDMPLDLGGLTIDHYEISLDGAEFINTDTNSAHHFSSLNNGEEYLFVVRAVTSNSVNNLSNVIGEQISGTNIPYMLPTLTIHSCVSSDEMLTVDFISSDLFGVSLDHYELSSNGGNSWLVYGTLTNQTLYNLTNGQEYRVMVRAILRHQYLNELLISDSSPEILATPYKVASNPQNITSVSSDKTIVVSWEAPADLGGLIVDHYEISLDGANFVSTGLNLEYSFTDLENGQMYSFEIRAITKNINYSANPALMNGYVIGLVNSSYNSPFTNSQSPINVNTLPSKQSVLLSWQPPTYTGGFDIHHYEVKYDDSDWTQADTLSSHNFMYLVNGIQYQFSVRAVTINASGSEVYGAPSEIVTSIPYEKPYAVDNLVCSVINNVLTITFDEPHNINNGSTQYFIYSLYPNDYQNNNTSLVSGDSGLITGTDTSFDVYVYTYINNPNDTSKRVYGLAKSVHVTNIILSGGIQNLQASGSSETSIDLNWEYYGDSSVTFYIDIVSSDGSIVNIGNTTNKKFTVSELMTGLSYKFAVRDGINSTETVIITYTLIGLPAIISASKTDDILNINSYFAGDSKANFVILANNTSTGAYQIIGPITSTSMSIQVSGVSNYDAFTVIISNVAGVNYVQFTNSYTISSDNINGGREPM